MGESDDIMSEIFNEVLIGNGGYRWVAGLLIRGIQSSPDRYACMMTRYAISYALCDFVQTNRYIIICDFGLWCQNQ